jgi:hypothetical protein
MEECRVHSNNRRSYILQIEWRDTMKKVTKKDVMDAIEYFWQAGYIEELTSDKRYYTKILLDCCAAKYKMELVE